MVGMVFGYILAETQSVPRAAAVAPAVPQGSEALPEGHQPVDASAMTGEQERAFATQVSQLRTMLE